MADQTLQTLQLDIVHKTDKAVDHIDKLINSLRGLRSACENGAGLAKVVGALKEVNAELNKTTKKGSLNKISDAMEKSSDKLSKTAKKMKSSIAETLDVGGLAKAKDATASVTGGLDTGGTSKVKDAGEEAEEASVKFRKLVAVMNAVHNVASRVQMVFGFLKTVISKVATPIRNGLSSAFKHLSDRIKQATKGVQSFFNSIKRIAMYRAIRSVIKEVAAGVREGIENLYQWSKLNDGQFSASMDTLATEVLYLKNAVGAFLSPVIQALVPIISAAIDAFVDLINVVQKLFSVITGRGYWYKALKKQTEFQKEAEKTTKALHVQLMGFDEINNITTPNSGSRGSDDDYDGMFSLEKELLGDKSLKDIFNEWIDNFDLDEVARKLAGKVNNIVERADAFITNIKWKDLGSKVARSFNTVIEEVNWGNIGKLVADKFNAAVSTVLGFSTTFNWSGAGKAISDYFNEWVGNVNWEDIGNAVSETVMGIFEMLESFLANADINGFVQGVGEVLGKVFSVENINKMLSGLDGGMSILWHALLELFYTVAAEATADTMPSLSKWFKDKAYTESLKVGVSQKKQNTSNNSTNGIKTWANKAMAILDKEISNAEIPSDIADKFYENISNAFAESKLSANQQRKLVEPITSVISNPQITTTEKSAYVNTITTALSSTSLSAGQKMSITRLVSEAFSNPTLTSEQRLSYTAAITQVLSSTSLSSAQKASVTNMITSAMATPNMTSDQLASYKKTITDTLSKAGFSQAQIDSILNPITGAFSKTGSTSGSDFWKSFKSAVEASSKSNPLKIGASSGGSITKNLTLNTVSLMADGGFVSQGSLFVAGEVGGQAEMVGNINGRTGVVSGNEISGIGEAVYSTGETNSMLLRELINVVASKDLTISPSSSFGAVASKSLRLYSGVTG